MVFVYHLGTRHCGTLLIAAEVDMDFRARAAGACVAHLPEVIMLVAVYDVRSGQMAFPISRSLVVTRQPFGCRAFKHGCIQAFGIQSEHVDQEFPRPINRLFLEIVAKRPVTQHFKHGMMVGVMPHLFQIVMLATDTQAFLAVGNPRPLRRFVAEDNILELIHARIGEHQRGVILDNHRGRRNNLMPLALEKLLEGLSYFLCSQRLITHICNIGCFF